MNKNSYTAANSFPSKIFRDAGFMRTILEHKLIFPRHVQLSPTDICNLKCSFCSCSKRERKEWSKDDVKEIVKILKQVYTKGVTITGGGEPLLFPYIEMLLTELRNAGISIGLVSNGIPLLNPLFIPLIKWVRFSFSDDREFSKGFYDNIHNWVGKGVDVSFSYVVTDEANLVNAGKIVELANRLKCTHVRMVSDILNSKSSEKIDQIKNAFRHMGVDDSLVIYQSRNAWTAGTEQCYISLLKPMIYSDGHIYPCCGSQYALTDDVRRMPAKMNMGHYTELPEIIKHQKYFNGEICNICYYESYNNVLADLLKDLEHLEFV